MAKQPSIFKLLRFSAPVWALFLAVFTARLPVLCASVLTEYEVKAAFLYQFTKFIEWPGGNPSGNFGLCIMGNDPFGKILNELDNEPVGGQKVEVRRIRGPEDADGCRMIFISPSEADRMSRILNGLKKSPVLTVSEVSGFLQDGGIINFVKQGNKIRFEINLKDAEKAGIKISSKLLSLAADVVGK